ncbi:MAG: hypothetical protein Kow0090_22990 [Myxococcota bacterium]
MFAIILALLPALPAFASFDSFETALNKGLFWAFLSVFLGGFLTSLTPCVYPVIPFVVSAFGARETRNKLEAALLSAAFVAGMAVMYSALGVTAALTGALFGSFLQNKFVVFGIALFFAIFAASMFGLFEIQLPASVTTRLNRVGGKGLFGGFIMGLFAGIIAAPCTGPVLGGVLLFVATTKSAFLGFSLLFTFAIGMGTIFFALGVFAVSLPKSGSWMDVVKVIFGVALLITAVYFIRPHSDFLKTIGGGEITYLWISLLLVLNGLLLNALSIAFNREAVKIAFKILGVVVALVGGTMLIGYIEAPQPIKSVSQSGAKSKEVVEEADLNIEWLTVEREALETAKKEGKPVMIDFSAEWCAACKELDKFTYTDARVKREARRFVNLKIDFTEDSDENTALAKKYNIIGMPTILFINSKGEPVENRPPNGFISAEVLLKYMREVD